MKKPILVYDGDCGICRYWVDYWHGFTGDSVEYHTYQAVADQFPGISLEEFRRSIQYIHGDRVYSGAQAVFVLLRTHFPYNMYHWLYRYLPGFAFLAETAYSFFSVRRGLLRWISYVCWGHRHERARYDLCSWIFLRCLGLIYFSAFASFTMQIPGLIGSKGILPAGMYLERVYEHFGPSAFFKLPTLFWLASNDTVLVLAGIAGCVFSLLLVFNILLRTSLCVLFVLWLSMVYAGQVFMQFQWDLLLVECGFLAILLATLRTRIIVWLYRWLAFRFMLLGGLVKIMSADPTWDNLTALAFHFETQPLPTALAWYAHHLPEGVLMTLTGATLFIEAILPFFIFLPRNFRFIAGFGFILLQTAIILTGNYNYFNLLTLAFCLFLFDDAAIRRLLPARIIKYIHSKTAGLSTGRLHAGIAAGLAVFLIAASITQTWHLFGRQDPPLLGNVTRIIVPFLIVNTYGPFAVMTVKRHEIIIQGSDDEREWLEYVFKYKPGDVARRPGWIIPHQPRLDWQMWFAALSSAERELWFRNLMARLLQGSSLVTGLFAHNPFPDRPPRYIRAMFMEYQFTNPAQRRASGDWWERRFVRVYFGSSALRRD